MASRLHPAAETLVDVEDRAPAADDNGRRRHVGRVGVLIAGINQTVQLGQEFLLGGNLSGRCGQVVPHEIPQLDNWGTHGRQL
jgi:hypothetical protein